MRTEPSIAQQLLAYASRLSGAAHAFLFLPAAGSELRCAAASGVFVDLLGRPAEEDGLARLCFDERRPLFRGGQERWEGLLPGSAVPDLGALALLPLVRDGRRAGVLGLAHEERGRGFDNRGGDMLPDLARFAASLLLDDEGADLHVLSDHRPAVLGEALGAFSWEVDTDRILAGAALARVLGRAAEDLPSRREDLLELLHPEDRHRLAQALEDAVGGGEFQLALRLPWPDGSCRWLECHGRRAEGSSLVVGWMADVSHVHQLEQRYRDLAHRHRAVLDALPSSVVVKDARGRIVETNRAARRLHGIGADGSVGSVTDPGRAALDRGVEEEVLRRGVPRRGEVERRYDAEGEEGWYRADRLPLKDERGEPAGLVVCHSPLEGVDPADLPGEVEEERVDERILEAPQPRREALNLSRLVQSSEEALRRDLPPQVDLDLRVTAQVLPCVGDEVLLRRALAQLVGNAAEALGPEGGLITVRCGRRSFSAAQLARVEGGTELSAGDYLFVEVSDPGCGMRDEVAAHVFDPLFSTKLGGRGMGLTLVQRIVRAHGGGVGVESLPRMGSTFSVLLPVGKAQGGPKGCIADPMSSLGAGVARPRLKRS